ncbi:MAG: DUF2442 domain-containing protein [Bacteroidota bacterium]
MITVIKVWFDKERIFVELNDQRVIGTPISWYPNLSKGTAEQMKNYELRGDGRWIHWPDLDEDLDAEGFLNYTPKTQTPAAAKK